LIQKKYQDGTIEDFPEWQGFEVAKLEGCILGDILSESELGPYFSDISQPIQFVTDSLAGSGTVKLKIGVPKFPSFATRPGVMKSNPPVQTERSQTDKEELQTPPAENPLSSCSTELFESLLNNDFYLVVGDECDNLPTEHKEINYTLSEQPEFFKVPHSDEEELKLVELILVCNDESHPLENGGSIPVDYKRYRYNYSASSFESSWALEPYKGIDDRVHYNFVSPQTNLATPLLFDFVTGICYSKINPPGYPPKTLINNLSDVNDPNKIPSNDYEQAFFDFCGQLCYPTERAVYVLTEIIRIHEEEHMNDFAGIVSEHFPELVEKIENYSSSCQSYDETIRLNAEKVVYSMINEFIRGTISQFNVISGKPGTSEELKHERDIQGRESITSRIEDYKDELKSRFYQLIGSSCQKCSYEK
jgi:hypothetical protein